MRSVVIRKDQVRPMISKKSGDRWIKISNVDRAMRTRLKSAIRNASIPTISPPHVGHRDFGLGHLLAGERSRQASRG